MLATSSDMPIHEVAKILGQRVVRGPDWAWGYQDGGPGGVGTVVKVFLQSPTDGRRVCTVGASAPSFASEGGRLYGGCPNTVLVCWDFSPAQLFNYRTGYTGKYDLRVYDPSSASGKRNFFLQ